MEGKYYFSQFTGVRCAHPIHLAYLSVSSGVISARSGDLETPPIHQKRPTPAPETTLPSAYLLSKNIILLQLTWSTFLPEFTDNLYYKEKRRSVIHYKPQLFLWLWQLPEGAISYFFFFFLITGTSYTKLQPILYLVSATDTFPCSCDKHLIQAHMMSLSTAARGAGTDELCWLWWKPVTSQMFYSYRQRPWCT